MNDVIRLGYLAALILFRLLKKLEVIEQQSDVDLSHLISLIKPITGLDGDFFLTGEQFDLL